MKKEKIKDELQTMYETVKLCAEYSELEVIKAYGGYPEQTKQTEALLKNGADLGARTAIEKIAEHLGIELY